MNIENYAGDDDDDWNPEPTSQTIFNKVVVDISDQTIRKNIEKDQVIDQQAIRLYKDLTVKEAMKQKKQQGVMEEEAQESDSDEDVPFDVRDAVQSQKLFDENLYNPLQDEKYESWVNKHLRVDKKSVIVLSCPGCFTQVSYDSQRHEIYENQYRSMFVRNCRVDCTRTLQDSQAPKKTNAKTQNILRVLEDIKKEGVPVGELHKGNGNENENENTNEDLIFEKDFEKVMPKNFEYFFPVMCENCQAEIGVYDVEQKVYHFFNTIPSLG